MHKETVIRNYLKEIILYKIENDKVFQDYDSLIDSYVNKNLSDLIIWFDNQLKKIENEWEVKLKDLFAHCHWNEEQQNDFIFKLLCCCSGTDSFPEKEFNYRRDLRGARQYFKKFFLPERPIYIDIYEGYIAEFFEELI